MQAPRVGPGHHRVHDPATGLDGHRSDLARLQAGGPVKVGAVGRVLLQNVMAAVGVARQVDLPVRLNRQERIGDGSADRAVAAEAHVLAVGTELEHLRTARREPNGHHDVAAGLNRGGARGGGRAKVVRYDAVFVFRRRSCPVGRWA